MQRENIIIFEIFKVLFIVKVNISLNEKRKTESKIIDEILMSLFIDYWILNLEVIEIFNNIIMEFRKIIFFKKIL